MDPVQLRQLLNHIHDATYHADSAGLDALGLREGASMASVRKAAIRLIQSLRPPADTPEHATEWRLYRVLEARYVLNLTQQQAAVELSVTVRHLARLQEQAVEMLADAIAHVQIEPQPDGEPSAVRQQVEQDVSSLYQQADTDQYDVCDAVQSALDLAKSVAIERRVTIRLVSFATPLRTSAPKAAVRQAALSALLYVLRLLHDGELQVELQPWDDGAAIIIVGRPLVSPCIPEPLLIHELLAPAHGEIEFAHRDDEVRVALRLPGEQRLRVLAIDDNSDQLHYYGRCVAGTRFRIEALRDGRQAMAVAREMLPDLIVLDVMLPNSDGWELLAQLTNDPATRLVPIVVCSVVDESDLAVSLGAAAVVAKPVSRRDFLACLQQAARREATTGR